MEEFKWYVLQVYSGHENKVKNRLEKLIVDLEGSESGATIKEVISYLYAKVVDREPFANGNGTADA